MLKILKALYNEYDVTDILLKHVNENGININVSNYLFGDPSPNIVKYLTVEYEIDDKKYTKSIQEGTMLNINTEYDITDDIYNNIDIIIPFKNSDEYRKTNLLFIIKYYKKYLPNANIIIVEQDTKTNLEQVSELVSKHLYILNTNTFFRKAYLFNQGFNISEGKYLILADADCVIDKNILIKLKDFRYLLDTNNYIIPYENVKYLNSETSQLFMSNDTNNDGENLNINYYKIQSATGGIGIISSEMYYRIGGHSNDIKGWGFEDDLFHNKIIAYKYNVIRQKSDLLHLYHPDKNMRENYDNNKKVYEKFVKSTLNDAVDFSFFKNVKIDFDKVKIVSNYINEELYKESKSFYEKVDFIEHIKINGSGGLYGLSFFEYVIKNIDSCDWMIYIDEDCFITDTNAMLDLLFYQIKNNISFSGMPDGGVISHRFHNPISINAFFTIINLKFLRTFYNPNINQFYNKDLDVFIPNNLLKTNIKQEEKFSRTIAEGYKPYGIIYDNFEPYYKIFFSMLRNNCKYLYLDAYDSDLDDLTTILKNHEGKEFAYHTWFARSYHSHKNRINNVINYCNKIKK
jgi:hypothetical protein